MLRPAPVTYFRGGSRLSRRPRSRARGRRIEGAEAYRVFLAPFTQILISSRMIAAFGDDRTALVMYDTETIPVKNAPGAECVVVEDGKITQSRFLFDRAPFDAARRAAGVMS